MTSALKASALAAALFCGSLYAESAPKKISLSPSVASSESSVSLTGSARTEKVAGFYVSVLGDPYAIMGINGAYNILDFARVTGGFGWGGPGAVTIGGGLKLMVPTWSLTPIVGINGVVAIGTGAASGARSESGAYMNAGLDFTSREGLNLGAGVQIPVIRIEGVTPYINVGYFF